MLHFPWGWGTRQNRIFKIHSKYFQAKIHAQLHHSQGGFFLTCYTHTHFRQLQQIGDCNEKIDRVSLQQCKTYHWITWSGQIGARESRGKYFINTHFQFWGYSSLNSVSYTNAHRFSLRITHFGIHIPQHYNRIYKQILLPVCQQVM